ncbi:hypothetical protein PPACK8108_LOCUS3571, partial [Phakopsora pachyrhizi]
VSLFACLIFLLYIAILSFFSRHHNWANARLAFMQTSFGPLFIHLILADLIQATALVQNFFEITRRFTPTPTLICTSQGVLVQFSALASALFIFLISIETFVILSNGPTLNWVRKCATAGVWVLSASFSCLGLLTFSGIDLQAFYTWSGAWCWIGNGYGTYRIVFHHIWIWFSATGVTSLYCILFWKIRTHYKGEGHILNRSSIVLPPPDSPTSTVSFGTGDSNLSSSSRCQRVRKRGLRTVSRTMLIYPVTFLIYSIPLTILNMLEDDRNKFKNLTVTVVFSTIFAFRGLIDLFVYGMTRNVFILRTLPPTDDDSSSSLSSVCSTASKKLHPSNWSEKNRFPVERKISFTHLETPHGLQSDEEKL